MIPIPIVIPRVDTEKKPDHVGEGLLQGLNKLCDHVGDGAQKLWRKPQEGHREAGALGAAKGVGEGLLSFATGVGKGTCDLLGSTLEGVRHTPDAIADKVIKEREHNKHGVEGEGKGELLESYIETEQEPEHIGDGFMSGVRGLGRGLSSGLQDLAKRPIEGAREGGAKGFAVGAGKGLLGFGTKAASGTLDFATSVLNGAKNTPDAISKAVEKRRAATSSSSSADTGSGSFSGPAGGDGAAPPRGSTTSFTAFSGSGFALGTAEEASNARATPTSSR